MGSLGITENNHHHMDNKKDVTLNHIENSIENGKTRQKDTVEDEVELISKKKCFHYTKRQWTIFLVIGCVHICAGSCFSLQAPLYPKLAILKGVTASIYGMVFGIYDLTNCIGAFIYGKNIRRINVKRMIYCGNLVMAISRFSFGFLEKVPPGAAFITFSFIIRIIEAFGQSAYMTAVYAIISLEFPKNVGTTFSLLEAIFALGTIIGPAAGGFMYEAGGFIMPFTVTGSLLFIASCVNYFLIPQIGDPPDIPSSLTKLLTIPAILVCYYAVISFAFSLGFIQVLLVSHLEQFDISSSTAGLIFTMDGVTNVATMTIWGYLAEKWIDPKLICAFGGFLAAISFVLIGPAPFIPLEQKLWLLIVSLILHGVGGTAEFVTTFLDLSKEAISHGFPDNIETYGLVSGLFLSGFSLGSFFGPTISGILKDSIGFRSSTLVVIAMHILVMIFCIVSYMRGRHKKKINLKLESSNHLCTNHGE